MGALIKAKAEQDREKWFTDTGNRLTSMQQQLDQLSAFQKQREEFMPSRRIGAATIGQQMGGTGLRIGKGGMSPSARRRMHRAG